MTPPESDWADKAAKMVVQKYGIWGQPGRGRLEYDIAQALQRVRDETIEECAKVVFSTPCCSNQACPRCPACEATQNIRALKENK